MIEINQELEKHGLTKEAYEACLQDIRKKVLGEIDLDWSELTAKHNLNIHPDVLRKASSNKPFGSVFVGEYNKQNKAKSGASSSYLEELLAQENELKKERQKLSDTKLEYNRWLREEARAEHIAEKIIDAIHEMPPFEMPAQLPKSLHPEKAGVLLIADSHYGTSFTITGLMGEALNEYSPEIFEARMWDLYNRVVEIVHKEGFTELNVHGLGDDVDGVLRVSQLMKLRYGVIESAVRFARFITGWLNELSKVVKIKFQMVRYSNHNQLRMLGQPKNTFANEDVSLIITDKIIDCLSGNPNFEYIQNPSGYIFDNILGYNVLGIHGEEKSLAQAIKDFSSLYKVNIDILEAAHKHHSMSETVGICSEIISAPSIIGADAFSVSLKKVSNAGATLYIIEEGRGKTMEYNIKLA